MPVAESMCDMWAKSRRDRDGMSVGGSGSKNARNAGRKLLSEGRRPRGHGPCAL